MVDIIYPAHTFGSPTLFDSFMCNESCAKKMGFDEFSRLFYGMKVHNSFNISKQKNRVYNLFLMKLDNEGVDL